MRLKVSWKKPIPLIRDASEGLTFAVDLTKIESLPGVYMFARKWGKSFEALYVGRSENLKSRINGHLNNHRLINHIEGAANGARVVIVGYPETLPGQQMKRVLPALERALIRHLLSEAHDLVNKHGMRIDRHEIESAGGVPRAFVPAKMFLERGKK